MDRNETSKPSFGYLEAETVSEDSENSSFSNFTDTEADVRQKNLNNFHDNVSPFLQRINKVKHLIQELEESFHESNSINNNIIFRCILLRAENQNLLNGKRRSIKGYMYNNSKRVPILCHSRKKLLHKSPSNLEYHSMVKTAYQDSVLSDEGEEIDTLHNTIGDLQKKLKERSMKMRTLYEKYVCLKTTRSQMEVDYQKRIESLENQLRITSGTLTEFQNDRETEIEKNLSTTMNVHEALFLQEKLRCTKLMYENMRLHHEIQRLGDLVRKRDSEANAKDYWDIVKTSSEPLMRHF